MCSADHYPGDMLASAGDDGNVLLWVPSESSMTSTLTDEHVDDKETWRIKHMCRTPSGAEIYDLAWSPDGQYFITGGVDNTARIFNAHTGMEEAMSIFLPIRADSIRGNDTSNCRTQSFCSGRGLGPSQ